jgi:hypothetical protein
MSPGRGSTSRQTDRLTDRQSQCDSTLTGSVQSSEWAVGPKREPRKVRLSRLNVGFEDFVCVVVQ